MLNYAKKIKYDKKDIIENTSLWEINIDIDFELNPNLKTVKKKMVYNFFKKIYPIEYNCKPLKYNINNTFSYKYNDNSFVLFNSLQPIPLQYLKKIGISNLTLNKRSYAKKILNNIEEKNKKKKNNNKAVNKNIEPRSNKVIFEELE
jgi:hypothetical protein